MPNEEIIVGLKNAIDRGENLQSAMQMMINAGYNPSDVQEASKFVGGGTLHLQEPRPDERLIMPEQKSNLSKVAFWKRGQKSKLPQMQKSAQNMPSKLQNMPFQQQVQPQQSTPSTQPILQANQPTPSTQPILQANQYSQTQISPQQPMQTQSKTSKPLTKELGKIKPKTRSRLKEIILLIILLILIGVLIATIFLRDKIISWFS